MSRSPTSDRRPKRTRRRRRCKLPAGVRWSYRLTSPIQPRARRSSGGRARISAARRAGQHGVDLQFGADRRARAADWGEQLAVDLGGSFFSSMAAVPLMRKHGRRAHHQFFGLGPASGRPRYKGYLAVLRGQSRRESADRSAGARARGRQILVNAIAPGPILAPPETTEQESEAVERDTPLGRWGGPEEIVKAVLALDRLRLHHRRNDPRGRRKTSVLITE